jgi:CSLREA domain-containing protein
MSPKRLFTILGLLAFALTAQLLFLAPPALAQGPVVNTAADKDDGECVTDCSLREAITVAASGETITFAGDYTITLTDTLVISNNLTIDGGGHAITVSGNNAVRVFRVIANSLVTLDTLTVTHGLGGSDFDCSAIANCGGGIKVEDGVTLTLTHSAVISNTAFRGGGVHNDGVMLVAQSVISGNAATLGGGIDSMHVLTVQQSVVANNSANGGAGIYDGHPYRGGSLTVEESLIADNVGGGIQADSTAGYDDPVTIRNSTIVRNTSAGWGGGIQAGTLLTIINTTIASNTAVNGGGLQVLGIDPVFITNTTISGNRATQNGGGIGTAFNPPRIYLAHSTVVSNTADADGGDDGQGGGLYAFQRAAFTLTHTILAGNLDAGSQTPDCAIVAPSQTGGIYSEGYNLIGDTTGCSLITHTTDLLNQNAMLEPLADDGGDTQTHALQSLSPAIDAVPVASCTLPTDQRGVTRPAGKGCEIGAFEALPPKMAVLGNAVVIANGDASPALTDDTDFGDCVIGQAITRTFTISNSGALALALTGSPPVTLTGPAALDFSLVVSPVTAISPDSTTTFQVRFTPSLTGTQGATVSIASNDPDANPYHFAIQGTGRNSAPIANAGSDQTVTAGDMVTLDGNGSSDPDGHTPLTYGWTQISGPTVPLSSAGVVSPTFIAPNNAVTLTFSLTVTDSLGLADAAPDAVVVTVGRVYTHLPLIIKN